MTDYAIETRGIAKEYGTVRAVDGLDLRVPAGSIYGFLGRNGAGKTTTIKMLLGMAAPSRGEGIVMGLRIDRPDDSLEIRRRTGFVSEDKGLYDYMTVEEMVRLTRSFFRSWRVDLEAKALRAFDLPAKRKVRHLSKGMRTKLALLLALCRGPRLLILDEPTEGLDPVMIDEVLQALVGLAAGGDLTIFFSSHQLVEVEQIADHVCILHHGRSVVEGSMDDLKENFRRVTAVFEAAPDALPPLENVVRSRADGRVLSFLVSSGADEVLRRLEALLPLSVESTPVMLKEIFLETVGTEGTWTSEV